MFFPVCGDYHGLNCGHGQDANCNGTPSTNLMNCYDPPGSGINGASALESHLLDETGTSPLVKTVSLPAISDTVMNVPISLVVQPDPSIPPAVLLGNLPAEIDLGGGRVTSMTQLDETNPNNNHAFNDYHIVGGGGGPFQTLPRSRSLVSCQTHKILSSSSAAAAAVGPRLQLFRNLHFARAHMFHVSCLKNGLLRV